MMIRLQNQLQDPDLTPSPTINSNEGPIMKYYLLESEMLGFNEMLSSPWLITQSAQVKIVCHRDTYGHTIIIVGSIIRNRSWWKMNCKQGRHGHSLLINCVIYGSGSDWKVNFSFG